MHGIELDVRSTGNTFGDELEDKTKKEPDALRAELSLREGAGVSAGIHTSM
jgi:hypothetical protein